MFRKLTEEDFAILRGPFESGRQSPTFMGAALFLSIFLQGHCGAWNTILWITLPIQMQKKL